MVLPFAFKMLNSGGIGAHRVQVIVPQNAITMEGMSMIAKLRKRKKDKVPIVFKLFFRTNCHFHVVCVKDWGEKVKEEQGDTKLTGRNRLNSRSLPFI